HRVTEAIRETRTKTDFCAPGKKAAISMAAFSEGVVFMKKVAKLRCKLYYLYTYTIPPICDVPMYKM
ncbi:MAG: hypothetical protein K2N94_13790, partial [Lachnospiraceae bacterium]|nr:hypothetical protein [Lachnospiraceae bacterium]